MDFIDTVFSFIPLLMIVFFFARIVSAAKKRNRSGPLKTILPPEQDRDSSETPKPVKKNKPAETKTYQSPKPRPVTQPSAPITETAVSALTENSLSRINRFSELKRAVIWAEILGKPKGLD